MIEARGAPARMTYEQAKKGMPILDVGDYEDVAASAQKGQQSGIGPGLVQESRRRRARDDRQRRRQRK
ncbi:TPA: hypothetical protein DCE37_07725 [Candidatus Latescibacteria bacterium]|nr:hypothetical protein [Candidatus Latescibacterota bacterium]